MKVSELHKHFQSLVDEGKGDYKVIISGNYPVEYVADLTPKNTAVLGINDFLYQKFIIENPRAPYFFED